MQPPIHTQQGEQSFRGINPSFFRSLQKETSLSRFVPLNYPVKGRNIAPGKVCEQSSVDEAWSAGRKASFAVDGCPESISLGDVYSFITKNEKYPWWQIDLGSMIPLTGLIIYNNHCSNRAATLCVLISSSIDAWKDRSMLMFCCRNE